MPENNEYERVSVSFGTAGDSGNLIPEDNGWGTVTYATACTSSFFPCIKEENMIGGPECHLCGARRVLEHSDRTYKKNRDSKIKKFTHYKCGTIVYTKNDGSVHVEVVGKKCLPNSR